MFDRGALENRLAHVGTVTFLVFLLLFGALAYWQVFRTDLANSQYNPRVLDTYNDPDRGSILDREGNVLVESNADAQRVYRDPTLSHVLGYLSAEYGSQGAELAFNDLLVGREGRSWEGAFNAEFDRDARSGQDVRLTIDPQVQAAAANGLGGRPGAVVALNPQNGQVLAMTSFPTYNPATINENGDALFDDPASPVLNRATQGLYPPGSTFKTVTASAILEHDILDIDTTVTCEEDFVVEGFPVACSSRGIGTYPFLDAFALSINAIFAEYGVEVGWPRLLDMGRRYGFQEALPFTIDTAPTQLVAEDSVRSLPLLASTAFGQGELFATPLQMAVVAATVANDGVLEQPHLGLAAYDGDDNLGSIEDSPSERILPQPVARDLKTMMAAVVEQGQAAGVALEGIPVAGKTGTAETGRGTSHAWFIAFAPVDDPQVAVAVLVEDGGQGSSIAAPIAGQVIQAAVQR